MDGFFSQALVLLGATLVLLPLFQRLGLGSILGYLAEIGRASCRERV